MAIHSRKGERKGFLSVKMHSQINHALRAGQVNVGYVFTNAPAEARCRSLGMKSCPLNFLLKSLLTWLQTQVKTS